MVTGLILPPKTDEQNAGSGIRGLATISHLTRPKRPPDHSNRNTVDRVTLPGGSGFERSVPRKIATVRVFVRVRPIYRRTIIRAVAGLGEPIELSGGIRRAVTHRPEAASHQGRAVGGASASRNRKFESTPLQRGVCKLSVPRALRLRWRNQINRTRVREVRIQLPPAESQQTFGPFRVVAIHKRSENQIHRTRVREVRIQFPPAASPLRTGALQLVRSW